MRIFFWTIGGNPEGTEGEASLPMPLETPQAEPPQETHSWRSR